MKPHYAAIDSLKNFLERNDRVESVNIRDGQILLLTRYGSSDIKVFLADIYILGEADVNEIIGLCPDINAIVVMNNWNTYTSSAKQMCKELNVGLFDFKEFLGAVYYEGQQFVDYISPAERERIRKSK